MIKKFIIDDSNKNERLDVFLSKNIQLSRSELQKAISDKKVQVNSNKTKKNYKLNINDEVLFDYEPEDKSIKPEYKKLDIVYEDKYLAILSKDKNVIVHPTETIYKNTLVNYLLDRFEKLSDIDGDFRKGIVHRLDKDTTGLIIIAKDNETHIKLKDIIRKHEIRKKYLCIVHGVIDDCGTVDMPIGRNPKDRKKMAIIEDGKNAISYYKRLDYNRDYSLVEVEIKTGRTHQIRVHMKYIHHPVLGDKLYGLNREKVILDSQVLHAYNLVFIHPITGKLLNIKSDVKDDFKNALLKTGLSYKKIKDIL